MKKPGKKQWLIAAVIMCVLFLILLAGKKTVRKDNSFALKEKQTWVKELKQKLQSGKAGEIMETVLQEEGEETGETVLLEETEEAGDVIILKLADEEELQIRKDEIIRTGDEEESAGVYDSAAYHVNLKDGAAKVYRNQQEETAVSGYAAVRPDEKEGDDAE